jgi:hypothetical protein
MTYLETLLESATAEAKSMHNENMRLNDQIKSLQVTLDKAVLDSNKLMTERLQRLNNEPNGEKLSWWQRLVVREALGMDNPTPPSLTGGGMALGVYRETL